MSEQPTDYPVAAPSDVEPVIYRAQVIQAMAAGYKKAADLSDEDAMSAALATWDTEWMDDPAPRTIDAGIDQVIEDLQYWEE